MIQNYLKKTFKSLLHRREVVNFSSLLLNQILHKELWKCFKKATNAYVGLDVLHLIVIFTIKKNSNSTLANLFIV
jgi:hypothetical protein